MKQTCAHPACTCEHETEKMVKQNGQLYCSTHCASASDDADSCACGHPDCGS